MLMDSLVVSVVSDRFVSPEGGLELVLLVGSGLLLVSPRLVDQSQAVQEVNEVERSEAGPASYLALPGYVVVG